MMTNKKIWILGLIASIIITACTPPNESDYSLGGKLVEVPQSWNITVADKNNLVEIDFAPMNTIDGDNVLALHFTSPEAEINFVAKNVETVKYSKMVYKSGDYKLYVAAVTRAGTGPAREVPFTVEKNLFLENMNIDIFEYEEVFNSERFYRAGMYIEQNSTITLQGAMASEDVIVNVDFFERVNVTTMKFLGRSGVYNLYWNPVRKNVIIEPDGSIASPNYYVLTGNGLGYPTTVSSEDIITAYGGSGNGRYTTSWSPGQNIRRRIVMRNIRTNTFQATVCINAGAAFKPYSNTDWGNDVFAAENCTFTGEDIIGPTGNWSPNENLDKNAYYRITLNSSTRAVEIKKVNKNGVIIP
jgi:hypothetical protein